MAGVQDVKQAIWLSAATSATNFVFTLVGVWLVERVGRRKLTLGSLLGLCPHLYTSTDMSGLIDQWEVSSRIYFFSHDLFFRFNAGTGLSLSVLAVGFWLSARYSPPATLHPVDAQNSTCRLYG